MTTIWRRVAGASAGAVLILVSVALFLAALEFAAGARLLPLGTVPWYRAEDIAADRGIDRANAMFAATHPFHFNAPVSGIQRGPGIERRIAVLGDSFVFGSGLPLNDAWPHQLARLMKESHPDTEIMSWGINGWSTKDQLGFLKVASEKFGMMEAEGVLVGFVTNDPDVGAIPQKHLSYDNAFWRALGAVTPDAHAYITAHLSAFHARFIDKSYGYGSWENALYSAENLAAYEAVLRELKTFCDERGLWVAVVLTPHLPSEAYFRDKYAAVTALLDKVGIAYINPMSRVVAELGDAEDGPLYPSLWANLANGHPGPALTRIYAAEVFRYLESGGHILKPDMTRHMPALTQDCRTGADVTWEPLLSYAYLGARYVRVRGAMAGPARDIGNGSLTAGDASYPLAIVSSGAIAMPGLTREFPPNSFWVDLPESTDLAGALLRLGDACARITQPTVGGQIRSNPAVPSAG